MPTLDYTRAPSDEPDAPAEPSPLSTFLLAFLPILATALTPAHCVHWRHEPFGVLRAAGALLLVALPAAVIVMWAAWFVLSARQRVSGSVRISFLCWAALTMGIGEYSVVGYLFNEPWTC